MVIAPNFLNRQRLNDLQWLRMATPLWQLGHHPLRQLNVAPSTLLPAASDTETMQADGRIGKYTEQLIHWWFLAAGIEVHHGLQIRSENRTVGEIDFLYQYQNQWHHYEVALKFYLCRDNPHLEHHWIGPNSRDRLDVKLSNMRERQTQLLQQKASVEYLQTDIPNLTTPIQPAGSLFVVRFIQASPTLTPPHPSQPYDGYWWRLSDFMHSILNSRRCENRRIYRLKKPHWLPTSDITWHGQISAQELVDQPLPWRLRICESDSLGYEAMVVADDWPHLPGT